MLDKFPKIAFDLSIMSVKMDERITDEIEALEAILMDDVVVKFVDDVPSVIETIVHPSTGDDTDLQFVCVTLEVKLTPDYPDASPEVTLRNPRGLDDVVLATINSQIREKLTDCLGQPVVFELIELIRENLTQSNLPSGQCVICLYNFTEGDVFIKTQCYHHFHSHCLANHLTAGKKYYKEELEKLPNWQQMSAPAYQDVVTRPVSAQSNGSAYSDNELWQNEIKSKMELSQVRLAALKQQQKRLLKYQEEAKQQLDEMNRERERQVQDIPSTSHDNFVAAQNQAHSSNYLHPNRMYAANQIGVATTLPHSTELQQSLSDNMDEPGHSAHSTHSQDERFMRESNVNGSEEAVASRDSDPEDDEVLLNERSRMLQIKLRELQMKKQHMENLNDAEDRVRRLEADKDSLQLQVQVLSEQISAQSEKMTDLERALQDTRQRLDESDQRLQKHR